MSDEATRYLLAGRESGRVANGLYLAFGGSLRDDHRSAISRLVRSGLTRSPTSSSALLSWLLEIAAAKSPYRNRYLHTY